MLARGLFEHPYSLFVTGPLLFLRSSNRHNRGITDSPNYIRLSR